MIIRIRRKSIGHAFILLLALLSLSSIFIGISFTTDYASAANVTNNTVLAIVNVTNTEPNVTNVIVAPSPIDLVANSVSVVTCNASVFDYNGWQDINPASVNASFYIQSAGETVAADNNHRYTNSSCNDCIQDSGSSTNASCACRIALQYYANDSSEWICNVTVRDRGGSQKSGSELNLTDSALSSAATVTKLLAINTTTLLDYGNLSVTQTSAEITHNVTNVGNINLNLSLRGYGGSDEDIGRNVTMMCELGNITFGHQRYAFGTDKEGTAFDSMKNLTNLTAKLNFTFPARIDDAIFGWDRNSTFWKLEIPLSVGGICNGTIIFGAVDAEV